MKIYLACDHAAYDLKEKIKTYLVENNYDIEDMGAHSKEAVNWAEYGAKAAREVSQDPENSQGIIICGTGIGMSLVSNKFKNVRAALCHDEFTTEMSRKHNDANVLNMGARVLSEEKALQLVEIWLNTEFAGEKVPRYRQRLDYLHDVVESKNFK
jgi:ribose 5-phosphate isomerase B